MRSARECARVSLSTTLKLYNTLNMVGENLYCTFRVTGKARAERERERERRSEGTRSKEARERDEKKERMHHKR